MTVRSSTLFGNHIAPESTPIDTVFIYTHDSLEKLLQDGGSAKWKAEALRLSGTKYSVVCHKGGDNPYSAFLVGRNLPAVHLPDGRKFIPWSQYALIDVPEAWDKKNQYPLRYGSLAEIGIDPDSLTWIDIAPSTNALTIEDIRSMLAKMYNVKEEQVGITINI